MENKISVTSNDGLIDISGLNEAQFEVIINSLRPASKGYELIMAQSFSQQKETFYSMQPELKELSNSQLRIEIEKQLSFGKICIEVLTSIEDFKKQQVEITALNK